MISSLSHKEFSDIASMLAWGKKMYIGVEFHLICLVKTVVFKKRLNFGFSGLIRQTGGFDLLDLFSEFFFNH